MRRKLISGILMLLFLVAGFAGGILYESRPEAADEKHIDKALVQNTAQQSQKVKFGPKGPYKIMEAIINKGLSEYELEEPYGSMIFAADPLCEIKEYEGCLKNMNGELVASSSGVQGTVKLNKTTKVKFTVLYDSTDVNGSYVCSVVDRKDQGLVAETGIYKYKDLYFLFNQQMDKKDEANLKKNMQLVQTFKKKFLQLADTVLVK